MRTQNPFLKTLKAAFVTLIVGVALGSAAFGFYSLYNYAANNTWAGWTPYDAGTNASAQLARYYPATLLPKLKLVERKKTLYSYGPTTGPMPVWFYVIKGPANVRACLWESMWGPTDAGNGWYKFEKPCRAT